MPVNFLSTVDTTGGNSGSPTLNAKGELVGLLFDGTYESVASDYLFDAVKTRSIHVDSRYMLWNMSGGGWRVAPGEGDEPQAGGGKCWRRAGKHLAAAKVAAGRQVATM